MRMAFKLAAVAAAMAVVTGCVSKGEHLQSTSTIENQDRVIKNLQTENDDLSGRLRTLQHELSLKTAELDKAKSDNAAMRSRVDQLSVNLSDLEKKFTNLPGVTIEAIPGGYVVRVKGEVLFDTGKTEIRTEGQNVLKEIADRLKDSPAKIVVAGHTDNVPVVVNKDKFPRGNLELSGERALVVADFLIHRAGIEPQRVSFEGHGEWDPKSDNSSESGRSSNRRVEIKVFENPTQQG